MNWHKASAQKPKIGKKVLIFRTKREKYTIASLELLTDEFDKQEENWVTEHGSCFDVMPDDAWIEFPYYKVQKEYGS